MHLVGRINRNIYECVTRNIITDEVIITEKRIEHIKERHPTDFERYNKYLEEIIGNPDYIIANKSNTAILLNDPVEYRNSVISFWHIGETTWNKMLKNKKFFTLKNKLTIINLE